MHVVLARDGLVSVSLQPYSERETHSVSFAGLQSTLQVEQSRDLVVREPTAAGTHTEQCSSSGEDAQRCESSTGQMAMTEELVIQACLEILDSECLSTAAVLHVTSSSKQISEQSASEGAQLCVSLEEMQEADLPDQPQMSLSEIWC